MADVTDPTPMANSPLAGVQQAVVTKVEAVAIQTAESLIDQEVLSLHAWLATQPTWVQVAFSAIQMILGGVATTLLAKYL